MSTEREERLRCGGCSAIIPNSKILKAISPFNALDTLFGCPECSNVNDFTVVCDESGCTVDASYEWPSENVYRHTCGKHQEK